MDDVLWEMDDTGMNQTWVLIWLVEPRKLARELLLANLFPSLKYSFLVCIMETILINVFLNLNNK